VARALELGARHLDVGRLPEEGHVVLADPEGNEFCVIEPGNGFLAGCGFIGALACDGSQRSATSGAGR
jgi:glyoxalase superfamily protein